MLALSDLISVETRDSVLRTLLLIAEDVGLKVSAWQSGQPVKQILVNVSQKVSDLSILTQGAIKGGLLDYAEEGWLTLLARSLYRVERNPAQFATGDTFQFTNGSATTYGSPTPIAAGDLIVAHSVTGKTYRNLAPIVLPPGVTSGIVMLADEAGTASNAGPGMITELVSGLADVAVTNVASVLGAGEETDPELRQRCRDKLGALSPNGPKEAYAYVAKTPALSAVAVPITRVLVVPDPATGTLAVYLATAEGAPSGGDITIVDDALDVWATPWCTLATAIGATEVVQDVTSQVWVRNATMTSAQIQSAISSALAAYFKTIPIGGDVIPPSAGKLFVGALERVIGDAAPGIRQVVVTVPPANVALGVPYVVKLGVVTTSVTVIP